MKKGDLIELNITGLGDNGEGVAIFADRTVFVPFAIPGENVTARVSHVKRDTAAFASIETVNRASERRVEPPCPFFGSCGGCQLMHMDYSAQLEFKRDLAEKNLRKIGGFNICAEATVPSEKVFGYRSKILQPVVFERGKARTGFFKTGSHTIVPVRQCLLQDEKAREASTVFEDFLNDFSVSVYDEASGIGLVRHFLARYIDGQLLFTVVINGGSLPHAEALYERLSEKFEKVGLFVNVNRAKTNVVLSGKTIRLKGLERIESKMCGINFGLQPDSFFQINSGVAEKIYRFAKQLAVREKTEALVECFSGIGILSGMLADPGYESFGVEISLAAWEDAERLKAANALLTLENICGDVNAVLPSLAERLEGKRISVVVDPPRKGLDAAVRRTIIEMRPQTIIYISCDSATFARDAGEFCRAGYEIETFKPFDLFPQTKHVETVACFKSF